MDRTDYDRWSYQYAATFGLSSDADVAMLVAWFEVFSACGYTSPELEFARLAVAKAPPKYRSDHLAAIHAAVRSLRASAARRSQASGPVEGEVGECTLCGNTGCVVVPHPDYVLAGQWEQHWMGYRPTAVVACSCWFGRNRLSAYDVRPAEYRERVKRPMRLEEYQRRTPRWADLTARRAELETAAVKAAALTDAADKSSGPLARVVRQVMAESGEAVPA